MESLDPPLDQVEVLLADCLGQLDGVESAVDAACASHPELAKELRVRYALLSELGVMEKSSMEIPERLGEFRLLQRLGGGGMGVVYLAQQTSLKRDVALKLIRPEHLFFEGARERFRREAQAIARLKHPGIVPIYTVGEQEGLPYFAMEYVHGCTLAEGLEALRGRDPARLRPMDLLTVARARAQETSLEPDSDKTEIHDVDSQGESRGAGEDFVDFAIDLVRQVALALQHAHDQALLHRDVKPSNILLTPEGRCLLCDFGLTSDPQGDRLTRSGAQVGTLAYMSPEQARGAATLDARVDVYSLGVTLYELLSLQLPFASGDAIETIQLIEEGEPDSLRARNRRVAEDVETVCFAAMEREVGRRYESCKAFAEDLLALLDRRPIRARRPGLFLRARRFVQRRPALSMGVTLGLVLAIGGPTQAYLHERDLRERETESHGQLMREAELTARSSSFLLGLFRGAATRSPGDEPLRAIDVMAHGVSTIDQELGDDPLAKARAEVLLARTLHHLREHRAARDLVDNALATFEGSESSSEQRGLYDALLLSAELDVVLGELSRAAERLDRLEALFETNPPRDAATRRGARLVRARWHAGHGRFEQAIAATDEVLNELESTSASQEELAFVWALVAEGLLEAGRYAESLEPAQRALEVFIQDLPERSPELLSLLSNLGLAHKQLGQLEQAAACYARAAESAEELYARPHMTTAILRINTGALEDQRGNCEGAHQAYSSALELLSALGQSDSPNAMVAGISDGMMLLRLSRFEECEGRYARWQGPQRERLGAGHPFVVNTCLNRATALGELGRLDEALEQIDRGLAELAVGPEQPGMREQLESLGDQLMASDD